MKKVLLIALAMYTIVACTKKDNGNGELPFTMANIAGNYTITGETTTINGEVLNSFDSSYPKPCDKLSIFAFTQSGSVTMTEGCTGLAQNDSYTIESNKLIINGSEVFIISSLTATNLVTSTIDTIKTNPITIETVATTFTRK